MMGKLFESRFLRKSKEWHRSTVAVPFIITVNRYNSFRQGG